MKNAKSNKEFSDWYYKRIDDPYSPKLSAREIYEFLCPEKLEEPISGWEALPGGAYKDVITGLTWYPTIEEKMNFETAMNYTEGKDFRLPTKEEFEIAEKNGIRDVFDDFKDRWFWSSSVHVDNSDFAWGFYGYYGVLLVYYFRDVHVSVRCVGR